MQQTVVLVLCTIVILGSSVSGLKKFEKTEVFNVYDGGVQASTSHVLLVENSEMGGGDLIVNIDLCSYYSDNRPNISVKLVGLTFNVEKHFLMLNTMFNESTCSNPIPLPLQISIEKLRMGSDQTFVIKNLILVGQSSFFDAVDVRIVRKSAMKRHEIQAKYGVNETLTYEFHEQAIALLLIGRIQVLDGAVFSFGEKKVLGSSLLHVEAESWYSFPLLITKSIEFPVEDQVITVSRGSTFTFSWFEISTANGGPKRADGIVSYQMFSVDSFSVVEFVGIKVNMQTRMVPIGIRLVPGVQVSTNSAFSIREVVMALVSTAPKAPTANNASGIIFGPGKLIMDTGSQIKIVDNIVTYSTFDVGAAFVSLKSVDVSGNQRSGLVISRLQVTGNVKAEAQILDLEGTTVLNKTFYPMLLCNKVKTVSVSPCDPKQECNVSVVCFLGMTRTSFYDEGDNCKCVCRRYSQTGTTLSETYELDKDHGGMTCFNTMFVPRGPNVLTVSPSVSISHETMSSSGTLPVSVGKSISSSASKTNSDTLLLRTATYSESLSPSFDITTSQTNLLSKNGDVGVVVWAPATQAAVATTAGAAVVTSVIAGGSSGGSPDALVMLMSVGGVGNCGNTPESESVSAASKDSAAPMKVGDGRYARITAIVVLLVGVFALHIIIVIIVYFCTTSHSRQIDSVDSSVEDPPLSRVMRAFVKCRFPSISVSVYYFVLPGLLAQSMDVVFSNDSGGLGYASLALVAVSSPGLLLWIVTKSHLSKSLVVFELFSPDGALRSYPCWVRRYVFPTGFWFGGASAPELRMWKPLINTLKDDISKWHWLVLGSFIKVAVLAIVSAEDAVANCDARVALLCSIHVIWAITVLVVKPYRIGFSNFTSAMASILSICSVSMVAAGSADDAQRIIVICGVLTLIMGLVEGVIRIFEKRRWVPTEKKTWTDNGRDQPLLNL